MPGKRITEEARAKIIARLEETRNGTLVAKEFKVSLAMVTKIAASTNILLRAELNLPIVFLLEKITGTKFLSKIAPMIDLPYRYLGGIIAYPSNFSASLIRKKIIQKLHVLFPDKKAEIGALELLLCDHTSVAQIKTVKKDQQDFRIAAGLLLRELRENCGQEIDAIKQKVKSPIVERNLDRIESGDTKLAASIYRDAIRELCPYYQSVKPEAATPYIIQLEKISSQLKA